MNERKHQAWNFWSAFVFFGAVVLVGYLLEKKGVDIRNITLKEATGHHSCFLQDDPDPGV